MSTQPDLSSRPHELCINREMKSSAADLYRAWTENFDVWFAASGTLMMRAEVDVPFFFETHFEGGRHPHYGRFLNLVADQKIEMTWLTGDPGTKGAETVLRIEFEPLNSGTLLKLTHAGFADAETRDGHKDAWPLALAHLDDCLAGQVTR